MPTLDAIAALERMQAKDLSVHELMVILNNRFEITTIVNVDERELRELRSHAEQYLRLIREQKNGYRGL
jgi:predicted ATPase